MRVFHFFPRATTRDRLSRTWLRLESLEDRTVLDGVRFALPQHVIRNAPAVVAPLGTAQPTGYTPSQILRAYGFDRIALPGGVKADGAGTTIAIVDAFDDPTIANDLHQFDRQFQLPDPIITKVNQSGGTTFPGADPGWVTEIALDVEWCHALAPAAKILLVEATDNSYPNLLAAVSYAAHQPGVVAVSMSWGAADFSTEASFDSSFLTPSGHSGVTFIAASGDSGAPPSYPAVSPNVLGVGGTSLYLDSQGNLQGESGWNGSGGGVSAFETQPAYQKGVVTQSSTFRTNPDVAYNSDPNTGFPVYDSYNNGSSTPWSQLGGTSDAAPQWAALIALADQGRALAGKGALDGPSQTLPMLYQLPSADFRDITTGSSAGTPTYAAGPGYDLVSGRGTPIANKVVADLIGIPLTTATTTTVTSSANPQVAGQPVSWTATVTATTNSVNFETGDFSQAAARVGGAIVTSPALDGAYALQLQRSTSTAYYEIRQSATTYYNLPTAYYSFLFEYTSNPSEGGIANFQDTASGFKAALHLSPANKLMFYASNGTLLGSGTTVLMPGQVYTISAKIGTGSNAAWEVRLNGAVELSGTGNLGTANNGSLKLGGNGAYTTTYYYDDVTINAQGYSGAGPTGTVQFVVDGNVFGAPVPLSGGSATSAPDSALTAGNHSVTASYSGDGTYLPSSGMLPGGQSITAPAKTGTSMAVVSSVNPSALGQSVTFTATVTPGGSGAAPTGTVQWQIDGTVTGLPVPVITSGGVTTATLTTSTLSAGTHAIAANYSGDSNYQPSNGSLQQTVSATTASTTTTVTSSANPQAVGQPVTWTATVTAATSPINFIGFETGDFSQAAARVGGAIVTSPALDGAYALQLQRSTSTAYYEIRQSATTYYNLPTAYYSFLFEYTSNPSEGGIANFQDTASGFKAALHLSPANKLMFYASNGTLLGSGTTVLMPGQVYTISAKIGTGSNAAWEVRLNGAVELSGTGNLGTTSNGSLKLGGNGAYTTTYYYDDVAINSQGYPGAVPTGTVQFLVDGVQFGGLVPLSGGSATSAPDSALTAGNHSVTASYSGDGTYLPSSGMLPGGQSITAQTSTVDFVDFETGDFSQAATHTGGAIVTSPALDGAFSLQLQRSNSVANVEIRQSGTTYYNLPTAYYSMLFEYTSNPGEGGIVNFQDTASGYKAALHLSPANKLQFYASTGALLGTGTTALTSGQVYTISAKVGTGSNAAWEVRINGNVELSGTGNLGTANNGSLKLGGNGAYTATYYYDDVTIDSQGFPGGNGTPAPRTPSVSLPTMRAQTDTIALMPLGRCFPSASGGILLPTEPVSALAQPLPLPTGRGLTNLTAAFPSTRRGAAPTAALDLFFADADSQGQVALTVRKN